MGLDVEDFSESFGEFKREASAEVDASSTTNIFRFEGIPDFWTMGIPPIEYLVPGIISRKTITLWTGTDGTAKTFLVQNMAIAVATGGEFLGRRCNQCPVLYLDHENPSFAVRERLQLMSPVPIPEMKIWGTWLEQQPPQIGSDLLLQIAREKKPMIIIDPFRYAHAAEENDSTEMMAVMQSCRHYAAAGGCVVILHHPAKTEGSTGRGSSAIRGAVDVAYLQEMSEESGLISLKCVKNRFGEKHAVTIRPDYEEGSFTVTDSPEFTKRSNDSDLIRQIIEAEPGLSQNSIHKKSHMRKARCVALLKEGRDSLWIESKEGHSLAYFPICSQAAEHPRNSGTDVGGLGCSSVPTSLGGNREQPPASEGDCSGNSCTMTACPNCGSFSIYRERSGAVSCLTCSAQTEPVAAGVQ